MIEIFVPTEAKEISEFIVWMIMTMPEFVTQTVPNGSPELAFGALNEGLSEYCKTAPKPFCDEAVLLADQAEAELQKGDEQASYEALNKLFMKFEGIQ